MLLILTKSRVGDFWNLVRKWFKRQFDAVASSIDFTPVNNKLDTINDKIDNIDFTPVEDKLDSLDEKITPYLYDECSVEDIDRMFETTTDGGLIIVPSGLIGNDGSMPIGVFSAVTGLTPV